jgi:hypothetical protein
MTAIDSDLYGADYVPLPLSADASLPDRLYSVPTSSREGLRQVQELLSDVGLDIQAKQQFNRNHVARVQTSGLDASTVGSTLARARTRRR